MDGGIGSGVRWKRVNSGAVFCGFDRLTQVILEGGFWIGLGSGLVVVCVLDLVWFFGLL